MLLLMMIIIMMLIKMLIVIITMMLMMMMVMMSQLVLSNNQGGQNHTQRRPLVVSVCRTDTCTLVIVCANDSVCERKGVSEVVVVVDAPSFAKNSHGDTTMN